MHFKLPRSYAIQIAELTTVCTEQISAPQLLNALLSQYNAEVKRFAQPPP
jgi:hypothetical protein